MSLASQFWINSVTFKFRFKPTSAELFLMMLILRRGASFAGSGSDGLVGR